MSDEPRCADCKYWGWKDDDADSRGFRPCRLFGDWPYFEPEPPLESTERLARVVPFAGADGGNLDCAPDFGCVQFQPRPQEITPRP